MIRACFGFGCLLIGFSAFAGNEDYPVGARSAGMGNASVSLSDVWSAHHNQAGLGFVRDVSGGVYFENRFMLKELSIKGGVVALPVKGGTFGLCITNFGYSAYSENKYSLSFAKAFGDKLSAGVAMDYLSTKIADGYGQRGAFAAEFGILAKPFKGLTIGAHVYNPTRAKLAEYNDERLPTILRLGGDYAFSEKVTLAVETEKDIAKKAMFKAGIEYHPVKELYIRAGVGTNPTLTCFGFGVNLKGLRIDVAANYHQVLGFSPQLGLTYTVQKKESTSPKID
ncbi:MAG: hypothetical protein ACJ77K_01225 [Bacteroidia bacterium]